MSAVDADAFDPVGFELGEWADHGACIDEDPDLFFPERGASIAPARAICRLCPVKAECLEHALRNDERHGIWGGMSERERRRIRSARGRTHRGAA